MKKTILIIPVIAFLLIQLPTKNDSELVKILSEISTNNIDISNFIKDYQLLDLFVNDQKICLTYTIDNTAYFSILNNEKLIYTMKDTFKDYIYTRFSFDNNLIINYNSLFNRNMITYDLLNHKTTSRNIKDPFSFNQVTSWNNNLYFYGGSESNCIYSLQKGAVINKPIEVSINPFSSNISKPLDNNLVLISNISLDKLHLECYNEDELQWEKQVPLSNIYSQLNILNFNNYFMIYFDNEIIKLDKTNGKNVEYFHLNSDSFKLFVINNKIYVIEKRISEQKISYTISVFIETINKFSELKSLDFSTNNEVYVLKKTIIFVTDKNINFYDLDRLEINKNIKIDSPVFFKNYIDDRTGNNILLMNNKYVFY